MPLDTVFIHALHVETIIGVHAYEQNAPRPLLFDLELGTDIREAAASDRIRDAIDYSAVSDAIIRLASERRFQLLETLAETVARMIFERFPIATLRMTIGKPGAVDAAKTVGVRIDRRREDYAACGVR
ncbi:dihydroneopterin aldolase [Nevskia sp.]|uniref:dihydroneopterin aldolase n=1 Tax=Nevskia sp. TaxID=1929292 RepID=UPI0025D54642|nr:dihydroneopterin aldolase [Nevskia sp.]